MNSATMFLNHITGLDHAYIDEQGLVKGGSYHPNFLVSGPIDPVENVVVDFSTIKKEIKQEIDHHRYGFDHKCWIIEGYSSIESLKLDTQEYSITEMPPINGSNQKSIISIHTSSTQLELPYDSIKLVRESEGYNLNGYSVKASGTYIQHFLNLHFEDQRIHIDCQNTEMPLVYNSQHHSPEFFRYIHGLTWSSSWGCQNLVHGHLSFIQTDAPQSKRQSQILEKICKDLNHTMFIQRENLHPSRHQKTEQVHKESEAEKLSIEYQTPARGRFYGSFSTDTYKVVVLDTETTIEHLVEFISTVYQEQLEEIGASEIFVSEGLSKGAFLTL